MGWGSSAKPNGKAQKPVSGCTSLGVRGSGVGLPAPPAVFPLENGNCGRGASVLKKLVQIVVLFFAGIVFGGSTWRPLLS